MNSEETILFHSTRNVISIALDNFKVQCNVIIVDIKTKEIQPAILSNGLITFIVVTKSLGLQTMTFNEDCGLFKIVSLPEGFSNFLTLVNEPLKYWEFIKGIKY